MLVGKGNTVEASDTDLTKIVLEKADEIESTLKISVYRLKTETGETIDTIGAFSSVTIGTMKVGFATVVELAADTLTVTSKITSPLIISDEIKTDVISPIASDSAGIAVKLDDDQTFGIYTKEGTMAATIDNKGNITTMGNVTTFGSLNASESSIP